MKQRDVFCLVPNPKYIESVLSFEFLLKNVKIDSMAFKSRDTRFFTVLQLFLASVHHGIYNPVEFWR